MARVLALVSTTGKGRTAALHEVRLNVLAHNLCKHRTSESSNSVFVKIGHMESPKLLEIHVQILLALAYGRNNLKIGRDLLYTENLSSLKSVIFAFS